ncbi:MAG: hypothetical protein IPN05_16320 [Sulfuritalea sp.]|nr:hypothetical protein [Sulfuritalea sp.]
MLTLVVPGLIWPRQALSDLAGDLSLPAFALLLGRGRLRHGPGVATVTRLADALGVASPLPAAALRRLAFGHPADDDDWLCLDPVRLRFEERSLVLDDPRGLALKTAEAEALAVALAPTFAALGDIRVLDAHAWNLRLSAPSPSFPDLSQSLGRALAPLPASADHAPWRRCLNEAQMVLHVHPVNRAREAAGKPLVNSVWPWGGGRLPARTACRHDSVWSSDAVIRGLALAQGIDAELLPSKFRIPPGSSTLALFDDLAAPAKLGDALAWRDALASLEAAWLAPALAAIRSGELDALCLLAPGERNSVEFVIRRSDLWKFWRKPRALMDAFAATESR